MKRFIAVISFIAVTGVFLPSNARAFCQSVASGTFDATIPHKNIDGCDIALSSSEIAAQQAAQAAYVSPAPPPPDLAMQLAVALINGGVIPPSALNADTLAQVNTTLSVSGKTTNAVPIQ